jgi:hypothetical protein
MTLPSLSLTGDSVRVQIQHRGRIISALQSTMAKLKRLSMRSPRVFVSPA